MSRTLYHLDAYCREFDASVTRSIKSAAGVTGLVLDRTAFYPTSGGQPNDLGTLGNVRVLDVTEEDHEIVHWLEHPLNETNVHGIIDWPRRFDHMQQHTGQHILSESFLELFKAQTVSFHLGPESCTIDLDKLILEPSALDRAEDRANEIIFADRPIVARFVSPEEVPTLGLRKAPSVSSDIRIVEVEGFDRSPCGGTHCSRSGEVGQIALRRAERRGQETRVEFVCGWRALRDQRWKNRALSEIAQSFSVKDREVAAAVQRLSSEAAEQRRELQQLHAELLPVEADRLLAQARTWAGQRVVVQAIDGREVPELRRLASVLTASPGVIALLGTGGRAARVVFARSSDAGADMASLVNRTCQQLGGKGGGQADLAQGGGFPAERLVEALELAFRTLTEHQGEHK